MTSCVLERKRLMKTVSILGSTGSIGTQSLDVCEKAGYRLHTLCAHRNITLLEEQTRKFRPQQVIVTDVEAGKSLALRLKDLDIPVKTGFQALLDAVQEDGQDVIINALMGVRGLLPTLYALQAGNSVALANKETLVAGGKLVTGLAKEKNIPVYVTGIENRTAYESTKKFKDLNLEFPSKRILAEVELEDCLELNDELNKKIIAEKNIAYGSKYRTGYAWKLTNSKKINYDKDVKGQLGLWNIDL